tara:strand:+ start:89 stop:988 length:900 start_codon:yes stop_codon:yes gene_type:complete
MRVVFSVYINFTKNDFDENVDLKKNLKNTNKFKSHYNFLKNRQIEYCKKIKTDYILFENDNTWKDYKKYFNKKFPFVSSYNIVNFYKIHLMYELSKRYEEVLYLDFDVVPITNENIFNRFDTSKGIACRVNHEKDSKYICDSLSINHELLKDLEQNYGNYYVLSERSPRAKYWNCRAMLTHDGFDGDNDVYNTGIILANRKNLKKLAYFKNFSDSLKFMTYIKDKETFWPKFMRASFGYDNETLFSYKMKTNNVNLININMDWHHTMHRWSFVPKDTKMVHVINKDFNYVEKYIEKNNL